ncbi:partial Malonyl-[acyl-carrier protein] O-methyltransferase, partial [Patescibacteria group bacterium]
TGQSNIAISYIKRALELVPDYLDALNNLGNVLKETGEAEQAAAIYRQVLDKMPNYVPTLNNLGAVLFELDEEEESISVLTKALTLSPDNADILQNLGNSYQKHGDIQQAVDAYCKSLELNPRQKKLYYRLWRLLRNYGNEEASRQVLEYWIKYDPDNHIAQHHYQAHAGYIPERASDSYIQDIFDDFASSFDTVLNRLDYRAPSLVAEAVANILPAPDNQFYVLDAGCGTGLSGIELRKYAKQLIGVDLSQGMLNKAKHRKLYDELIKDDLVSYLTNTTTTFNVIISADTLVYFGALEAFLNAAKAVLTQQGVLAFTLEKYEGEQDFCLNYHGRYAHSPHYVTDCLMKAGLILSAIDTVVLRKERGEPVIGLLVTAKAA